MTDWTAGYIADYGYTFGYYPELNPLSARLAFLNAGLVCPAFGTACELGFGQGVSVNVHAAAGTTQWYGNDFNPAQAAFAQELAAVSGAGAMLTDDAFADFALRADLPDFDYIGLHGIWSWVSAENRAVIVDFIRRKLKVGGVVYISYNTLPGWSAFAPMRHLLTQHANIMGAAGESTVNRVDGAVAFADKFFETNSLYDMNNPSAARLFKQVRQQSRHYLAHEYFNRDWEPMHFATLAEALVSAKLDYACPANYVDHVDAANLTPEQETFLKEIPDAMFRETVRDFMVNKRFRRDYWVKGARRLSALERREALRAHTLVLTVPRAEVSLKATGSRGDVPMTAAVYAAFLDVVADNHAKSLGQIMDALRGQGIALDEVVEAAMLLIATGQLASTQDEAVIADARPRTDALNKWMINHARVSDDIQHLVSPVTGSAMGVEHCHKLFLLAMHQGKTRPADWAEIAWHAFEAQGKTLTVAGKALASAEENLAELNTQAKAFAETHLPVLKALQIA